MKTKRVAIRQQKSRKNRQGQTSFEKETVIKFLSLLNTVKIYHWKTYSYATHKATDELYSKLNENIDRFMEVLLGKIGNRVNLMRTKCIPINDFTSLEQMKKYVMNFKSYLVGLDTNEFMKKMSNSDLYTIRDEILADLNQFLYLLTFK
jgi:DNA-binding ferritin-like protein